MNDGQLILVRLGGEVGIKSRRTRAHFQRRLVENLRDALANAGAEAEVESVWQRIYIRTDSAEALTVLPRVFGISTVSPVEVVVPAELERIVDAGAAAFAERVAGRKYAVRARRSGEHPFRSKDIEIQLGAALNPNAEVDLDHPDVTVYVEVRDDDAYLFTERIEGARGLPLGTEGRAIALISGGYDSAVAAWLMLRRGVALDYVFCNLGGDAYERAVVQVAKVLADDWSYGHRPRFFAVDFAEPVREMRENVKQNYWQVVLKRLMYRTASTIARRCGSEAIVTGEAIGQVSSQTLTNLRAIEPASALPVFRPLLGFDKNDIIARAREVGTAALSEQVKEYCALAPGKPVTAASVQAVDRQEDRMDLGVVEAVAAEPKMLDLRELTATDLVQPYLFTTDIPDDAVVLDCRTESRYRTWHLPRAEHRDEWALLSRFKRLDKDRTYVLYCQHGIQTAYIAEKMQRAGYEAYSFKGGVGALMRWAREHGLARDGVLG